MSTIKVSDLKAENEDIVYYNASLYNPNTYPIPASITDIRSQNVIDYPEDWHMSVVRFDISTLEVPTAIIPMQNSLPGYQPSLLTAILSMAGIQYSAPVQIFNYASSTFGEVPPIGAVFSYSELITQINAAYAAAYALIPGPTSSAPPYFAMDAQTNILRCYFQDTYITDPNAIGIGMNYSLYTYLVNMPHNRTVWNPVTESTTELLLNTSFTIPISNVDRTGYPRAVSLVAMPGQVNYVSQETKGIETWDSLASIFITSNALPIQSEYLPTTSTPTQNQTFSSQSSPVISDFVVDTENPLSFRQKIEYLPTAEYRMIHLAGREGIKRVDAQFWYRTKSGQTYPIILPPQGSCGLKIMFRRAHAHQRMLAHKEEIYRNPENHEERATKSFGTGRMRAAR